LNWTKSIQASVLKLKLINGASTSTVVNWFYDIPEKNQHKFLKFDIIDFYPSINEKLLSNAITFAKRFTEISNETIKITAMPESPCSSIHIVFG